MKRLLIHLLAVPFLAATVGAAPASDTEPGKTSTTPKAKTPTAAAAQSKAKKKPKFHQVGTASWYGRQFQGRQTASGETFDMYSLTAAHRTLPLGTWVRVTNLRNGNWVIVRINDRGPVPQSRMIDLSYEAATLLDMRAQGLSPVRVEAVDPQTVAMVLNAPMIN